MSKFDDKIHEPKPVEGWARAVWLVFLAICGWFFYDCFFSEPASKLSDIGVIFMVVCFIIFVFLLSIPALIIQKLVECFGGLREIEEARALDLRRRKNHTRHVRKAKERINVDKQYNRLKSKARKKR